MSRIKSINSNLENRSIHETSTSDVMSSMRMERRSIYGLPIRRVPQKKKPTFQLCAAPKDRFSRNLTMVSDILDEVLEAYETDLKIYKNIDQTISSIANLILSEIKSARSNFPRFKIVCNVVVCTTVQACSEDALVTSGFLWHPEMGDNYCSLERKIGPHHVSVTVYGCYHD